MHLEACWHGQTVKMIFPDPGCSHTPSHPSWFPPLMVTVSVPASLTESQLCLGPGSLGMGCRRAGLLWIAHLMSTLPRNLCLIPLLIF